MTRRTFRLEVRFAGFGIADDNRGRTHAPGVAARHAEIVNECRQVRNLLGGETKRVFVGGYLCRKLPSTSPTLSFIKYSERSRFVPPFSPPRASSPWQYAQLVW